MCMVDSEQNAIIRHANKLVRHEVAKLSPVAQNLMALLFSIWTKEPREHTALDLTYIRTRLGLTHQEDSYLEKIILETGREIVNKSFIMARFDGGAVVGSLIYWFQINDQTQKLEVSTTSAFMDLFRRLKDGYAEYDFLTFYKINSKQGKNIYYLCRKNFKGQFTMNWGDFRRELGYKDTANNKNIMIYVKKAVDYLISHQYLQSCTITPIYSSGRGRPLTQIHFEYTFPESEAAPKVVPEPQPAPVPAGNDSKVPEPVPAEPTPALVSIDAAEPEPFAPAALPLHLVTAEARDAAIAALPRIEDVIEQNNLLHSSPKQATTPEDELKRLEMRCPTCGAPMAIKENRSTHVLFWACPDAWKGGCQQKTITLPAEIAETYWKHKKH